MIAGLPYVPYGPTLSGMPHVFVDGLRAPDTTLELSHWPGNRTPGPFKADVSTQSVLSLLADPGAERYLNGAEAVTCDHYDIDGLLSVWSLTAPASALSRRELLEQAALTGDFDVWTSPSAVRACLALEVAEQRVAADIARLPPRSTNGTTAILFRTLLGRLPMLLDHPYAEDGWRATYATVEAAIRAVDSAAELIEELPHLDLAIVAPGLTLHPYAVNSRTERLHVAGTDAGRHWMRQRYESFVDLQSRPTAPRVRADLLAAELNELESWGTWMCEPPDTATPCLQLYASTGTPARSSLSWDVFIGLVVDFFERAAADPDLRWGRDPQWYRTSTIRPPSGAGR